MRLIRRYYRVLCLEVKRLEVKQGLICEAVQPKWVDIIKHKTKNPAPPAARAAQGLESSF